SPGPSGPRIDSPTAEIRPVSRYSRSRVSRAAAISARNSGVRVRARIASAWARFSGGSFSSCCRVRSAPLSGSMKSAPRFVDRVGGDGVDDDAVHVALINVNHGDSLPPRGRAENDGEPAPIAEGVGTAVVPAQDFLNLFDRHLTRPHDVPVIAVRVT